MNTNSTKQKDLFTILRSEFELLGLDSLEANIMSHLVTSNAAYSIKEISELLKTPTYVLYPLLNTLAKMGFIEQISQKPKRYVSDILLLQQSVPLYEQEIYTMIDQFRTAIKKGPSEVYKLLGFDDLQIKVFECLLEKPSTRKDLGNFLDLPYEKVRNLTDTLLANNYIKKRMKGKAILYFPVDIEEIVESQIQQYKKKLDDRNERLEIISKIVDDNGSPLEISKSTVSSVLEGYDEISRKINAVSANATEICSSMFINLDQDFSKWKIYIERELEHAIKHCENGRKVKWLVCNSFLTLFKELNSKLIHNALKLCPNFTIKITEGYDSKIVVIDEDYLFRFPKHTNYLNQCIKIRDKNICKLRRTEFLNQWDNNSIRLYYFLKDTKDSDSMLYLLDHDHKSLIQSFNIAFMGEDDTGKTSIIDRFLDANFDPNVSMTHGIEIKKAMLHLQGGSKSPKNVKLVIHDFAGLMQFRDYYKTQLDSMNCFVLVFALNNPDSLDNLRRWINFVRDSTSNDKLFVLLGTKCDLSPTIEKGRIWDIRKEFQIEYYYETSALSGHNVAYFFKRIAELITNNEYVLNK